MGESYTSAASISNDIIRLLFSWLDRPVYNLLGFIYKLFFNVASADIFSNDTIMKFYSRVQLVLGVFMMFHLAMIILKGIMNPDSFTDSKSGIGNLITRICVALFLLTALVPINISSPQNEYEKQINNNGLLFGTLFSLQHRVLLNNTIGRLILGTDSTTDNFVASGSSDELDKAANIFTASILKGFYRINLAPEEERNQIQECVEADDPATIPECRMCSGDDVNNHIDVYKKLDASPDDIISMVNEACDYDCVLCIPGIRYLFGDQRYIFNYSPIISTITGVIFVFILLSFTIDIAVRLIKLAILRLLAPIPIISYIDPKGSKDGAFNSWVKVLTSTYLDLFMRLAIVFFIIFIIQETMVHGIVVNHGTGVLGILTLIIIWIGLFIFAKQAPKFIRQVLGLKDDNFRLFGGISDALGVGAMAAGTVGGAMSGFASKYQGNPENLGKALLGGITGAAGGTANAGKAFFGGKDINAKNIMDTNRKYNSQQYTNAADESTPWGRFKAGAQANLGLKNDYQKMEDKMKYYGAAENAIGRINKAFDGNGDAKVQFNGIKNKLTGAMEDIVDSNGNTLLKAGEKYSLKDYNDILNRVNASGDAKLIEKVDSAKKAAQSARFDMLRTTYKKREDLEAAIASGVGDLTTNDLVVWESAKTIYDVASKYSSEPEFARFTDGSGNVYDFDHSYVDSSGNSVSGWGYVYKHDAGQAGKTADQIKNSDKYAQAKANAQRAQEKK